MERHKPDWVSAIFGGLFVLLAVVLPISRWADWDLAEWVLPFAVVMLGAGIGVAAGASMRNQSKT